MKTLIVAILILAPALAAAEPTVPAGPAGPAEPAPRWRVSGAIALESLLEHGVAATIGVEPAPLPRWRFTLSMGSHDLPDFQIGLSGANDNMYVSVPISIEAGAAYRTRRGLVLGARAGVVHLHFTRLGTFGIDEEFDYGVTPYVGFEWSPVRHVYVQPWLGAMVTLYRQTHGELPMEEAERTYAKWPSALRGGILVGAVY